jgi:hypothetical protein
MNFLWIIQVLQLFLYSKSISKYIFLFSLIPGLGALIQRKSGFNSQNIPDSVHSENGRRVGFYKI